MKKLAFLLATCGIALLANTAPALAQSTPPNTYTSCSSSDSNCWANTGYERGYSFGANNPTSACEAEGQRANEYANYYRSQPASQQNNNLILYWDYYADGIYTGHSN